MRLIRFKQRKGHSQIALKMSYTYHNLCCIPVAFDVNSSTSDNVPQLL